MRLSTRAESPSHGALVSTFEQRDDHESRASMRVRSRASDAECPEALPPVYSVLHALAIY